VQRCDGSGREIRELQLLPGLVQHLSERHRDGLEQRHQALEVGRRQSGKKQVLPGVVGHH
jgi:hypothetical protein